MPDFCKHKCEHCEDCTATRAYLDWLDECRRLAGDAGAQEAIWPPLDDLADQAVDAEARFFVAVEDLLAISRAYEAYHLLTAGEEL